MADQDNYDYDSDEDNYKKPSSVAEFKALMLKKKKRLEKKGLLPTYDYPEPKGTTRGGKQTPKPITVLNDNPGPQLAHQPWEQSWERYKGILLTSRKYGSCLWKDESGGDSKSHMEGVEGWRDDTHAGTSVYQSTHNVQALTKKKLKPEKRGQLQQEPVNPKYSITGRNLFNPYRSECSPGPRYDTRSCNMPNPKMYGFGGGTSYMRYPPIVNDGEFYLTEN